MIRKLVKWSLFALLAVVGLTAVVGPARVRNAGSTVQDLVASAVESVTDPRIALRNELDTLSREYPARIAALRSQVKEVDRAMAEVRDDLAVAEQVVALSSADLEQMADDLEQGTVAVSLTEAPNAIHARIARIHRVQSAYQGRQDHAREELARLQVERQRLVNALTALVEEEARFHVEMGALAREIDSLERNETLLRIAQERQRLEAEGSTARAEGALGRVRTAIERARLEQEERLKELDAAPTAEDYEGRARLRIELGLPARGAPATDTPELELEYTPSVQLR